MNSAFGVRLVCVIYGFDLGFYRNRILAKSKLNKLTPEVGIQRGSPNEVRGLILSYSEICWLILKKYKNRTLASKRHKLKAT